MTFTYSNDTIYQSMRKIAVAFDPSIPCCNLPPIQIIGDGTITGDGMMLGNPETEIVFGDLDSGVVFGSP